jgi:hypothetical protein
MALYEKKIDISCLYEVEQCKIAFLVITALREKLIKNTKVVEKASHFSHLSGNI